MKRKFIYGAIILSVVFAACGKQEQQAQGPAGPPPFPVNTVSKQNVTSYTNYAASIEGEQNVEIRPKIDGFIEEIYVEEGDWVKEGQLLFKINADQLEQQASAAKATIAAAAANVEAAKLEVDKLKPLVEKNIVSQKQLATAESNLSAANAALHQATANYNNSKENLGYAYLKSPVSGVLGSIPYKVGALVGRNEAQPLTTVADISKVRAYFSLNEKQLLAINRQFKSDKTKSLVDELPEVALVLIDGSEYEHKGEIKTINGLVNTRTGSTQLQATFPNPDFLLRSGSSGEIKFPVVHKDVFRVPQNATFEMQNKKLVYVVGEDNTVKPIPVEVVTSIEKDFIIKSGLNEGDRIVTAGANKLKDGMKITPEGGNVAGGSSTSTASAAPAE
ncbi:efflux RND transporter periplasmic adaptor subunit [Fulvivirga ulvae]|uniref:efflux RND transporter periplasmic adaptor subunit n=1 Tax=Fulvivirga ulvae TaxID=2904245 RepID=UPI001F3F5257|nr:efflux RND transporter periplasmic adaptor subunit [Fulvivirga ulvae]UII34170.1 efflux RND transporter periplasmic adaptor subunit [Fulvivirga ulvae]